MSVEAKYHLKIKLLSFQTVRIWDVNGGRCLRVIWTGEQTSIMAVSCHGNLLACASAGRVAMWDHSSGNRIRVYKAHKKR